MAMVMAMGMIVTITIGWDSGVAGQLVGSVVREAVVVVGARRCDQVGWYRPAYVPGRRPAGSGRATYAVWAAEAAL
jgi:hypothetical protein